MTDQEVKRLEELNKICMECIREATKDYRNIDRQQCMICQVGMEIHKFDHDNIDGPNSARYERYFTA